MYLMMKNIIKTPKEEKKGFTLMYFSITLVGICRSQCLFVLIDSLALTISLCIQEHVPNEGETE
mgnify:FL=1